ncbi:MAG: tyrosine-type recombinase/integrase [Chloroflexi bacterium]|nr:tyrosine-type recombinase/integrase [Chloroflexota bacterium]
MRGHIVKRGENSYSVVIRQGKDTNTGKYLQSWFTVKGGKKDAEKKLAELLHQLDTGTFMKPGKTTLGDFLDRWLHDYACANLAPRTAEGYDTIIHQHLIPKLGSIPLTSLKPEHIQKYYGEMLTAGRSDGKGALNPLTVRHHHMTLHNALKCAVKWGLLIRNPADSIDAPRATHAEMKVMTENQLNHFLEVAKSAPYYSVFYLALFTGMRRSELLALQWSDVDLLLCQVSVNRTLHRLKGGNIVFRPPKTAKGRRTVSLSPSTALVLQQHLQSLKALRLLQGNPFTPSDLVFSREDGSPLSPNAVTSAWLRLVKRAGLEHIRLHDARHTHASLMLKQGIHPKIVQERLGHSTIAITLDTYSHVAPGLQDAAAKSFDLVLSSRHANTVAPDMS